MEAFFDMWNQHLHDHLHRPELDLNPLYHESDFDDHREFEYGFDDHHDIPHYDQPTEWERTEQELKISAPDPDDLCGGCGRSHDICDCFDDK